LELVCKFKKLKSYISLFLKKRLFSSQMRRTPPSLLLYYLAL